MSNPIELIREGILRSSWSLVCEGFTAMTGMKIDEPTTNGIDYSPLLISIRDQINEHLPKDTFPELVNKGDEPFPFQETAAVKSKKQRGRPKKEKPKQGKKQPDSDDDDEEAILNEQPGRPLNKFRRHATIEPDDVVTSRARELANARLNPDEIKTNPTPAQGGDKRQARTVPWEAPDLSDNRFTDDGKQYADLAKESKKLSANHVRPEPRPGVFKVKAKCFKCGTEEMVEPIFAKHNVDPKGNDISTYQCDSCIRKVI